MKCGIVGPLMASCKGITPVPTRHRMVGAGGFAGIRADTGWVRPDGRRRRLAQQAWRRVILRGTGRPRAGRRAAIG
jgi:hypothetical protein